MKYMLLHLSVLLSGPTKGRLDLTGYVSSALAQRRMVSIFYHSTTIFKGQTGVVNIFSLSTFYIMTNTNDKIKPMTPSSRKIWWLQMIQTQRGNDFSALSENCLIYLFPYLFEFGAKSVSRIKCGWVIATYKRF